MDLLGQPVERGSFSHGLKSGNTEAAARGTHGLDPGIPFANVALFNRNNASVLVLSQPRRGQSGAFDFAALIDCTVFAGLAFGL